MATVAALLAQYQAVKAQISFYTLEQLKWQELHDSMSEKVTIWQKYEDKWNDASDDYMAKYDEGGKLNKKGKLWLNYKTSKWKDANGNESMCWAGDYIDAQGNKKAYGNSKIANGWITPQDQIVAWNQVPGLVPDPVAELYANQMVSQFANGGADKLEEYANLDMEYEAMQTTYETMLASLRGQEESLKTAVDEGAKDTGMSSGG